jgi:hypothetical protein
VNGPDTGGRGSTAEAVSAEPQTFVLLLPMLHFCCTFQDAAYHIIRRVLGVYPARYTERLTSVYVCLIVIRLSSEEFKSSVMSVVVLVLNSATISTLICERQSIVKLKIRSGKTSKAFTTTRMKSSEKEQLGIVYPGTIPDCFRIYTKSF